MKGFKLEKTDISLLATAAIWGTGFLGAKVANVSGLSPAMILFMRFGIAALVMGIFGWRKLYGLTRKDFASGMITGSVLFLAFYLQTIGLRGTSVSNNAFLTTTNVIMVPLILWMIKKKRPSQRLIGSAILSMLGIWFLTWSQGQGLHFQTGDVLSLACAFFYACHIISLGHFHTIDSGLLTLLQMGVAAVLSFIAAWVFPVPMASVRWSQGIPAVLYLGLFPTCLAFFLQTWAQKRAEPAKAAVLLSLEGLFACVFSILLGFEVLTIPLALGGLIMVTAVLLAEWPEKTAGVIIEVK